MCLSDRALSTWKVKLSYEGPEAGGTGAHNLAAEGQMLDRMKQIIHPPSPSALSLSGNGPPKLWNF